MNFKQIKKEFRKVAIKEFTDMEDFTQEELNSFLFYFNQCRTEEQIIKVLNDWCIDNCAHLYKNMRNKKYYIDYLYNHTNDLYDQIKSIQGPGTHQICTDLDKQIKEHDIDDIYANYENTVGILYLLSCHAYKIYNKLKKQHDSEFNGTQYDSSSSDDEDDNGEYEGMEFDPNSDSEED